MDAMNSQMHAVAELRHDPCCLISLVTVCVSVCTITADTKHKMNTFYGTADFHKADPPPQPTPSQLLPWKLFAEQERTILLLLGRTIPSTFLQQTNQNMT